MREPAARACANRSFKSLGKTGSRSKGFMSWLVHGPRDPAGVKRQVKP